MDLFALLLQVEGLIWTFWRVKCKKWISTKHVIQPRVYAQEPLNFAPSFSTLSLPFCLLSLDSLMNKGVLISQYQWKLYIIWRGVSRNWGKKKPWFIFIHSTPCVHDPSLKTNSYRRCGGGGDRRRRHV